jgi:hypothetical protein
MAVRITTLLIALLFCTIPVNGLLADSVAQEKQGISRSPPAYSSLYFNIISGLTWGGNQFVVVGSHGLVLTSPDGTVWEIQRYMRSGEWLRGVTWGNDRYVAVGVAGKTFGAAASIILTSSDGITWAEHHPTAAMGTRLIQVDWVNFQFVAVGMDGLILTSSDGVDWTRQDSGTVEELRGIAGGNGQIVVVGKQGAIVTSSYGKNWTRKSLEGAKFDSVAWSGQEFVAVGGVIARSLDGQEWEVKDFGGTTYDLSDVTWSGTHFVAVGSDILISPDGREWTFLQIGAPGTGYGMHFLRIAGKDDSYVATGIGGEVFTSHDGMTWRGGKKVMIYLNSGQARVPDTIAQTSPRSEATEMRFQWLQNAGLVGLIGSLPLYIVLQVRSIKRLRGGWRVFAVLPLAPIALILIETIIGLYQGANLWPLGIILLSPIALGYLVLLLALHTLLKRGNNNTTPSKKFEG